MSAMELPPCSDEMRLENNSARLYASTTIIIILTTLFFGLRLYSRSLTLAKRGWDETLLPFAWVILLGLCGVMYSFISFGDTGRHLGCVLRDEDGPEKFVEALKLIFVLDWFYVPSSALSRISVLIVFLRVFTGKKTRMLCWVVIGLIVANTIGTLVAALLECDPLAKTWDSSLPGTCFDLHAFWQYTNLPNILIDVFILLLPIRTVWSLDASLTRKTGISFVFLSGSIGLIASSIRTSYFYKNAIFEDTTWTLSPLLSWTVAECGLYFIAACLVGLRPVLTHLARRSQESTGKLSVWPFNSTYYQQAISGHPGPAESGYGLKGRERVNSQSSDSTSHPLGDLEGGFWGNEGGRDSPLPQKSAAVKDPFADRRIRVHTEVNVQRESKVPTTFDQLD